MRTMKKIFIASFFLLIKFSSAQDIHFSQFYANPLQTNPAKTGFITNDFRFTGSYRNQWGSITTPYVTSIASTDFSFVSGKKKKNISGAGIMLFNDRAGDGQLNTTQINLCGSVNKAVGKFGNKFIGIGFIGTYSLTSVNFDNLRWDEQFDGGTFTENFDLHSDDYFDLSTGIEYNYLADKSNNFTMGFACYHLFKPRLTFNNEPDSRIFRKYVFNAGANLGMGNKLAFYPKMMLSQQGKFREIVFGFLERYSLNYNYLNDYGIYLGAFMRWNDAFVFMTKMDLNRFSMGISYDFNFSRLAEVSHAKGGPEISVIYTGNISGFHKKKIYCPRF